VESCVNRAKHSTVPNPVEYWDFILRALRLSPNTALFIDTFDYITGKLGINPSVNMFNSYCACIHYRTLGAGWTHWLLESKDAVNNDSAYRKDKLPADAVVMNEWQNVKSLLEKYSTQLDSEGYSFIVAALARSRFYDEANNVMKELEEKKVRLNIYGYMGQIICVTHMDSLVDEKITRVTRLLDRAKQEPALHGDVRIIYFRQ